MDMLPHLNGTQQQDFFSELTIVVAAAILRASGMTPERAAMEARSLEIMVRTGPPKEVEHAF